MAHVRTENISKDFGGVHAVRDLSLAFEPGKVTSLIGPNGSGKSTLINLITGMHSISSGAVYVGEHTQFQRVRSYEIATYGITRTFQNVRLFNQMPVIDNILLALTERNVFKAFFESHEQYHIEMAREVLERVGLREKENELAENLSYGQRKLLEVARVLAMDRRMDGNVQAIFLDEPFAGLFPEMRKVLQSIISSLKDQQKVVVLVEHNMEIIRELSDYVYVLDAGSLLADGTPQEVLEDEKVIEAYFGN